ncbi:hypothetical protein Tco_1533269 [Tanacetum coccineum]
MMTESDSEHETDENKSVSKSDKGKNEEDEDDEEDVKDKLVKTSSNDSDDEDETKITGKAEGDEDAEMDYTTSQLYDDVDIRLSEPVDTDKVFVQEEDIVDDEEDDEVIKELYDDVNVNLGNDDTEMTDADQGTLKQQNVSQESGFKQIEEDAHVTLTPVIDAHKADEPVQSSFVSSDFTSKLLNLENPSPDDNEIASLMETLDRHATAIPEITSGFTTTTPPTTSDL